MISLKIYLKKKSSPFKNFVSSYKEVPVFRDFTNWVLLSSTKLYSEQSQSNGLGTVNSAIKAMCCWSAIHKRVFCQWRGNLVIWCYKYVFIFKRISDIFTTRNTLTAAFLINLLILAILNSLFSGLYWWIIKKKKNSWYKSRVVNSWCLQNSKENIPNDIYLC